MSVKLPTHTVRTENYTRTHSFKTCLCSDGTLQLQQVYHTSERREDPAQAA